MRTPAPLIFVALVLGLGWLGYLISKKNDTPTIWVQDRYPPLHFFTDDQGCYYQLGFEEGGAVKWRKIKK